MPVHEIGHFNPLMLPHGNSDGRIMLGVALTHGFPVFELLERRKIVPDDCALRRLDGKFEDEGAGVLTRLADFGVERYFLVFEHLPKRISCRNPDAPYVVRGMSWVHA